MTIPKILLVSYLLVISHSLTAQETPEVEKKHNRKTSKHIEQMPSFPYNLGEYVSKNMNYPDSARKQNIEGRVLASFIVEKDGSINKVKIVNGIGGGCDEEVIRIIESMPKWKPGKHNGKIVKVKFYLPITFMLED